MKKLLVTILFLLACGGGGGSSSADTPKSKSALYIRLVLIDCPTTTRCAKQDDVLEQFARKQAFYKSQLGLEVILSGFDKVTDPEPDRFMTVEEFNTSHYRFYSIRKHLHKLGIVPDTKGRESLLIIDKYLKNPNESSLWVAGLGHVCGIYKPNAWSVTYSASGGPSAEGLKIAIGSHMAHEYGHYCGAQHSASSAGQDFMDASLWAYDTLTVPPSKGVLEDINKCLTRRAYVKVKKCNTKRRPKLCKKNAGLRDLEKPIGEIFGAFK